MLIAVMLAYQFHEINFKRYFKVLWRMTFLVTLMIYIILILGSIVIFLQR